MSNVVISSRNPKALRDEIQDVLSRVPGAASEAFKEAGEKTSKAAVKTLKSTAPKRTGKSAKSWRVKKENGAFIIHSAAPGYRIAHLLEHGHRKRNGGMTKAFKYIAPVEKEAIETFEREFEEKLEEKFGEITK